MTGFALVPTITSEPATCYRCRELGLPPLGIAAGDTVIEIQTDKATFYACTDCYSRLWDSLMGSEDTL